MIPRQTKNGWSALIDCLRDQEHMAGRICITQRMCLTRQQGIFASAVIVIRLRMNLQATRVDFLGASPLARPERKAPSRKGSAHVGSDGTGASAWHLARYQRNTTSEIGVRSHLSALTHPFGAERSSAQQVKKSLRTAASDQPCRCVTPLQMLELEHLAMSELGITEDVLIENAATAIAQTARKMVTVSKPKTSRKKRGLNASLPTPLIVVLAGNHRTGSRAIAAARQLRNHDAEVLLCVLGLEREIDLLDNVRRQLSIFRKCGGRIVGQNQLMETLNDLHVSNGNQLGRHLTTELDHRCLTRHASFL